VSHWTNIDVKIQTLAAAEAACRELGFKFERAPIGQKLDARGYNGLTRKADAVIRLPGPYDVALTREANGSYSLACDFWNGHVERSLGKNCQKFTQLYGVHVATAAARAKGYQVRRMQGANGSINLVMSVP